MKESTIISLVIIVLLFVAAGLLAYGIDKVLQEPTGKIEEVRE